MTDPKSVRSNLGVHFFYITLMLALCIVLLVTYDWTRLEGFTEYLSVAATVTSLVLGILAIIYGFVSSGTISQSLGSVESSSFKFTQIAAELSAVLEAGQRAQGRAEERTNQLHGLVDDMRSGLNSLSETTQRIEGSVESIPDRINSKSLALTDSPPSEETETTNAERVDRWDDEQLKTFLSHASPIGRVALYAAWQATKKDKFLDTSRLVPSNTVSYVYGFLIATSAAGVVQLEFADAKSKSMKAVRLKDPTNALDKVLTLLWDKRAKDENSVWAKTAAKYGPKVEDSLIDRAESGDGPTDVI